VSLESQYSTGVPTCHDFPRFVIVSEKSRPEDFDQAKMEVFLGKRPPTGTFSQMFSTPHREHGNTSFCANFVKFGRPEVGESASYLMDKKKQNFGSRSRSRFCAYRAKICRGQLQTIYSEFPKCHPNPFTSGGVIAERVNSVQTRHKVFAILGEA